MRSLFFALPALAWTGCSDKTVGTDSGTTGDSTPVTDDSSDDTSEDLTPVWEESRIEISYTLTGVYASGAGLYAVSQGGHSYVREDGAWTALSVDTDSEDLNDLWGAGSAETLNMFAVGNAGYIARWPNTVSGDAEWTTEDIGTANLEAISGATTSNLMSGGWGGVFTNSGGEWEYQDVARDLRINDVWYDGDTAMLVGQDGGWAYYHDAVWTEDSLSSRANLYGVSGISATDIWAVGEDGLILHWDGSTWTEMDSPTDTSMWAVLEVAVDEVYIAGNNGKAYAYDGIEWTALPTGVENNLYRISSGSSGVVWAVGNRGMVLGYKP